jgi:hypothetical protein
MTKKEKRAAKEKLSARHMMGIDNIGPNSLETPHGELVFFGIRPDNLSVLSEETVRERIYALTTVLKGIEGIEMLCVNSRENFEDNKRFLKKRLETEDNPFLRRLLESDMSHLDKIQAGTATAREFFIIVRLKNDKAPERDAYLSRIEKNLSDRGFAVKRAQRDDLKKLLGVYFEQNVTAERFEDFDGERWMIFND